MRKFWSDFARLAPAVLVACALSACSSDGSGDKDSARIAAEWAAEVSKAKAAATSEFEKAAFADDKITPDEYEEAVQRYVKCMQDTMPAKFADGVAAVKDEFGIYVYNGPQTSAEESDSGNAAYERADEKCGVGTKALIEPLYVDRIMNPQRQSPDEQMLGCLKRHNVVDNSYTMDNFKADRGIAQGEESNPKDFDPSKATGLDLNAEPASKCMITPWY